MYNLGQTVKLNICSTLMEAARLLFLPMKDSEAIILPQIVIELSYSARRSDFTICSQDGHKWTMESERGQADASKDQSRGGIDPNQNTSSEAKLLEAVRT